MKVHFNDFMSTLEKKGISLSHILLHGSNQSEIKEKCGEAADLLCGPAGREEMRIIKLSESILLKDPEKLYTTIKTISFFPGKQIVIIEDATDKISKTLENTLVNWTPQDATIILISNNIKPTSSLRKMVESNPSAVSTAVYDNQRNIEKIEELIETSKLIILDKDILSFLKNPVSFSSMHSFVLFLEKLKAYKFSDPSPITFKDIDLLMTEQHGPDEFELLTCLASGDIENTIHLIRKLFTSGLKPNTLVNSVNKHFVLLHKLSVSRHNLDFVLNSNFPPLFGNKRRQIIKHSEIWSTHKIERVISIITQLERKMRASPSIELNSLLERSFLRICTLRKGVN